MQAQAADVLRDDRGRHWPARGPLAFAQEICECPVRYILDRDASLLCAEFVLGRQFPVPDDPVVRIPFQRFWMEYFGGEGGGTGDNVKAQRFGVLGDVAADGRSGMLRCFGETDNEEAHSFHASIAFDFDNPLGNQSGVWRLRHGELCDIDRLLECARLVPDDDWLACARGCDASVSKSIQHLADCIWSVLPVVLSFAMLLNAQGALGSRTSDLGRLNGARIKRGRVPLLDHVEISLRLGTGSWISGQSDGFDGHRRTPRLHFVRGHQVHRAGATFWRTSHFRGENGPVPITTARVTARR